MTISGAIGCILLLIMVIGIGVCAAWFCDSGGAKVICGAITTLLCIVIVGALLFYFNFTESGKRALKSEMSNLHGGIERTVTVYDYNGNQINSWTGTFDVTASEHETYFDVDGKRVVIHGGIVINEER